MTIVCSLNLLMIIFLALLVYVDDVIITGTSSTTIENVKATFHSKFTIKDLGFMKISWVWKLLGLLKVL